MKISDLIEALQELEDDFGNLDVELDSGIAVSSVDVFYEDEDDHKPTAVVVK